MKSVTEFPTFKLLKGLEAKNALAAEGKTPEEIQQNLGEKFKLEGEKLTYFTNAIDVAGQNRDNLSRVIVVKLNEGESAPAKATQVDDFHYIPEFTIEAKKTVSTKADMAKASRGKGRSGPKESPWGLSPEQQEAKKNAGKKAPAKAE
jgi:hypothetical protein